MRKASLEEVRSIQLELLSEFDTFCKSNDIPYIAFAGTLLGTIRHKGFIPWDNDIDVAVSRSDYEKLRTLLRDEGAHPYFRFLCYEDDPNYLWQHGRISAKHTFLQTARGYSKLGLSIDVFPLDSQGNNLEAAKKNLQKIKNCVQMRIMAYDKKYKTMKYPKGISFLQKVHIWIQFYILHHSSEEYWVRRHIKLAQLYNKEKDSKYYGCNSNDKYTVVCERKMYNGIQYMPFEDREIPVPISYDEILRLYYGDYMKLPPKEKQIGAREMSVYIQE